MAQESQIQEQSVPVVEADVFDTMNETNALIAERAYEIYQTRGGTHGSDQEDWFKAEQEILPKLAVELQVTSSAVRLTAKVPGFNADDLEVALGHQRAVIMGVHKSSSRIGSRRRKKVMRIVELPFEVNPGLATAALRGGVLHVVLPRA